MLLIRGYINLNQYNTVEVAFQEPCLFTLSSLRVVLVFKWVHICDFLLSIKRMY